MTLSEIIYNYRKEHHLSMRSFASLCGLSNGYISMLENGKNPQTGDSIAPNLNTLQKLSNAMCITCNDLLSMLDGGQKARITNSISLLSHEQSLIHAYRSHPEMQSAVDKLLGIEENIEKEKTGTA